MDCKITFSGRFNYRFESGVAHHYHPDYQIQVVYSGEGEAHVNGRPYKIGKNSIMLIPKGSSHDFKVSSEAGMKTVEVKFVSSDPELENLVSQLEILMKDDGSIFDIMSRIVLEGQRQITFYKEMSNALLVECILLMFRIARNTSVSIFESSPLGRLKLRESNVSLLDLVDDCIAKNIHKKISPYDVSVACGYNQDYIYRVIRKKTGVSTIGYINQKKFEWAKQLIMYTGLSLSEIAWNLGFETVQYFSRFFKEYAGIPPSEYSRKIRSTIRTDY